jgi:hypothetical protein
MTKKFTTSSSAIQLTFWQLYSFLSSSQSLTFFNCSYFVDKLLLYNPSRETTYFTTLCLGTTQKCHQTATLLAQGPGQKSCTYTSQSNHEFMCVSEDSGVKSIRLNRLAETGTRVHSLVTKLLFISQELQPNP